MPIEAELKANVRDPEALSAALDARAEREAAVYRDRYFDSPNGAFATSGHELRIRSVERSAGVKHVLTFKAPAVDEASGSKPEHETTVGDPDITEQIVLGLGYKPLISFTKVCTNYRFKQNNREILATVVTVPEIDGTFIEVETIVEHDTDLANALTVVRAVLSELGIKEADLTTELYTDAVAAAQN